MKHLMGKINNFLENYFFIPKGIAQKWYIILVIVGIALPVLFSLFGDNSKKDNPFSLTSQITIL